MSLGNITTVLPLPVPPSRQAAAPDSVTLNLDYAVKIPVILCLFVKPIVAGFVIREH